MGSPSRTYFCKNGHIVLSFGHHCVDDTVATECPYCYSNEFAVVHNWGDPDYPEIVPFEPIDEKVIIGYDVKVYNVKNIPSKDWKSSIVEVFHLTDIDTGKISSFYSNGSVDRQYFAYSVKKKYNVIINLDKVKYTFFRNVKPTEKEKKYCLFIAEMNDNPENKKEWYRVTYYEL